MIPLEGVTALLEGWGAVDLRDVWGRKVSLGRSYRSVRLIMFKTFNAIKKFAFLDNIPTAYIIVSKLNNRRT